MRCVALTAVLSAMVSHASLITLKVCILQHHCPPLWCWISALTDTMLSHFPTAMALVPPAAVCMALAGGFPSVGASPCPLLHQSFICQVCLHSGLVSMGIHHYCSVVGGTDANSFYVPYTNGQQSHNGNSNISYKVTTNQELFVVKDKVGRPRTELGVSKSMECDIFPSVL